MQTPSLTTWELPQSWRANWKVRVGVGLWRQSPTSALPSFFASIRIFSNELTLGISLSINPSNEYSGLISFRINWLDLLVVQGTLNSLLQCHCLKESTFWCSAFFMVQFSHPYMTTRETIALTRQTFVGKVICQVFKYAVKVCHSFSCKEYASLISWLQSASAVILEPKK